MPKKIQNPAPEIVRAFRDHDRQATFHNFKVACVLGIVLMPVGMVLDRFVYPQHVNLFAMLRLVCSSLIAVFLAIALTERGRKYYRGLGLMLAMLPTFFMSWMIHVTEGATSSYYAGLTLVLMIIGFVLNWTFLESLVALVGVLIMYSLACFTRGSISFSGALVNNLYFLILTGIVVVTGSHYHTKLRFREFALRFQLDASRRELEASNQRLTELDQAKSRLFANISHELRTPLTLLIAPLENMLGRADESSDPDTRQMLVVMRANAMRLLKLINDLLDLVRLDSGVMQVKREPVMIGEFLRGLVSAARQLAADRRLRLEAEVAPDVDVVMVDRDKLEKVILNLQFNALKFTPPGGQVKLQAARLADDLVIWVADTGMGISEKNMEHVFDRFWQADNSAQRKFQGVGIGLALVKELTEAQGGKVSVQSQEGKGTTFTVRLPYLKPEKPLQSDTAPPIRSPEPVAATDGGTVGNAEWLANLYRRAELFPTMNAHPDSKSSTAAPGKGSRHQISKVLIADDEPDMLQFLKSQVQSVHQVIEAVDGVQAVEKSAQFLPDLILMDMMMPRKDGIEACREIRQRALTKNIPIIMLTARADEETKLAALSAGANDFLPKPFSSTELHVRIKNLLDSHFYQTRLARQNRALEDALDRLKKAQTQLVQSEKLASLGRLSAGIIHEVNNPLNFATTGLFTLRDKARFLTQDQQADYTEVLKDIEDGLGRVRTIISDLRTFSHPTAEEADDVPVHEVVAVALRFTANLWKDKIHLVQEVEGTQVIRANKNRLIQVLINLLQNSADALSRKSFPAGEEPTLSIASQTTDGQIRLVIRDNGEGIAPEHLDKIFDPFFTTKDVGEGMGLGLSICYSIVQEYGGQIRVRSERGKFCEFALEFPACAPEPGNNKTVLAA